MVVGFTEMDQTHDTRKITAAANKQYFVS